MSSTVMGVDVSSWQHEDNKPIDWWTVYAEGFRFAIIKATQGTSYYNPWTARDIEDANAAGLLVGAYHYFESGEDPAAQAKWFTSNLVMQRLDLGAFVDWECYLPAKYIHTQELSGFLAEARLSRPQCGVYCSEQWAAQLEEESVNVGRLWVSGFSYVPPFTCFAYQSTTTSSVPGIPSPACEDYITNTRGVDIPTAPPAKPTAEPLYSLKSSLQPAVIPFVPFDGPADDKD
jgi:GH25 family lysozyme M1 (1,4-beta-N-acetylmuramidase)